MSVVLIKNDDDDDDDLYLTMMLYNAREYRCPTSTLWFTAFPHLIPFTDAGGTANESAVILSAFENRLRAGLV